MEIGSKALSENPLMEGEEIRALFNIKRLLKDYEYKQNYFVRARDNFLFLLDKFFLLKHMLDYENYSSNSKKIINYKYLRNALRSLGQGDIIITTNYDTLPERVLLEQDKWTPADVYGFPVKLVPNIINLKLRDSNLIKKSLVLILKLHGSVGMRRGKRGIFLENVNFLDKFDNKIISSLKDRNEPNQPVVRTSDSIPLTCPSFIKLFDNGGI